MTTEPTTKPPVDPKERCGVCGLPRDAHWQIGGRPPIAEGRCTGFLSDAPKSLTEKILAEIARCQRATDGMPTPTERAAEREIALDQIERMIRHAATGG